MQIKRIETNVTTTIHPKKGEKLKRVLHLKKRRCTEFMALAVLGTQSTPEPCDPHAREKLNNYLF